MSVPLHFTLHRGHCSSFFFPSASSEIYKDKEKLALAVTNLATAPSLSIPVNLYPLPSSPLLTVSNSLKGLFFYNASSQLRGCHRLLLSCNQFDRLYKNRTFQHIAAEHSSCASGWLHAPHRRPDCYTPLHIVHSPGV